jgi:gentisate 1,2-dioxygenase
LERVNPEAETAEEIVKNVLEDVREVLALVKGTPREALLIVAAEWKYAFAKRVSELTGKGVLLRDALRSVLSSLEPGLRKQAGRLVEAYAKNPNLLQLLIPREVEYKALSSAASFYERELGVRVKVLLEEESGEVGKVPLPARPAILVLT